MRALKTVILLAALFALYTYLTSNNSERKAQAPARTPAPAPAKLESAETRRPAAKNLAAGVTVTMDTAMGRGSMRIVQDQNIAHELQLREIFLNRYRIPGPVAGAENFELLKLKAVPSASYRPELGDKIEEKFGFVIFSGHNRRYEVSVDGALPVVAKTGNGMLGIVTGTIMVTLKDAGDAETVAQSQGLTLKYLDHDLKLAFFSAPPAAPLDQIAAQLKNLAGVTNVTLEVVQARKRL